MTFGDHTADYEPTWPRATQSGTGGFAIFVRFRPPKVLTTWSKLAANDNEIIMKIMRRVEEDFIVRDNSNKEDSQTTTDRHHEDFLSGQYDGEFWIKVI